MKSFKKPVAEMGLILMPEGRNGSGWRSFASEMQVVVRYTQSILGGREAGRRDGRSPLGEGNNKLTPELNLTAEMGEKRPFVEVLKSLAKSIPSLGGSSIPMTATLSPTMAVLIPTTTTVKAPTKTLVSKGSADSALMGNKVIGRSEVDIAYGDGAYPRICVGDGSLRKERVLLDERLGNYIFREMLLCLKRDVEWC